MPANNAKTIINSSKANVPYANVYPNPANNKIIVEIVAETYDNGYICMYNYTGANVMKMKVNNGYNAIDVSNLPSGIYLYRIASNEKILQSEKITILR